MKHKAGETLILVKDLEPVGYPFESYGLAIGDEVTVIEHETRDGVTMYDVALSRDKRRKIRVSEEELGVKANG